MSRHLLLDRPDRHVVLGFDHPLRSLFGQVFAGPASDPTGAACDGWPTSSGLGDRRPAETHKQFGADLGILAMWAKAQIPDEFAQEEAAVFHLGLLLGSLAREWSTGEDASEIPLPDCLRGARA